MLEVIRLLAEDTIERRKLADICYGTVTSQEPLKIMLEQKLELTEEFLVLTKNVTRHFDTFRMRRKDSTDSWEEYERIWYRELLEGERVVLMKMSGGQRYVVLDRVGEEMVEDAAEDEG